MDNPETKEGSKSLGLFQESYMPVTLHVDTGFDFEKTIYKQTLLPLTNIGETIIFKNRFYGCSTTFSIDPKELAAKGYNKRSSEHLKLFGNRDFDRETYNITARNEVPNVGRTSNAGSTSGHNHGFTNPNFNLNVAYQDVIIAQKN